MNRNEVSPEEFHGAGCTRCPDDAAPVTVARTATPLLSPLLPADNRVVTGHVAIIHRLESKSSSCQTRCPALAGALPGLAGAAQNPGIASAGTEPPVIFGFVGVIFLAREKPDRRSCVRIVGRLQGKSSGLDSTFSARADHAAGRFWAALLSWSIRPSHGEQIIAPIVAAQRRWFDLPAAAASGEP